MKVLLINSHGDEKASSGRYRGFYSTMPPINLAYIAASLEAAGHEVSFHDDELAGGDPDSLRRAIEAQRPALAGLSCVTPSAPGVYETATRLKALDPSLRIMMGNIHADLFHEEVLRLGLADFVVHGEGEETAVDLARALERGEDLAEVRGISYLDDGRIVKTPSRPFIMDLDRLPRPAWHLFPIDRYRIFGFARVREPGALICGSRGCPYGCTFCCLKTMGRRRRVRSTRSIVDEMEWLHDRFGYRQVSFIDPIFPLRKEEGMDLAREITSRGLERKIVWVTETRVDNVDGEVLERMRRAGLRRIMYGFESADDEVLEGLGKGFSIERAREAVRETRRAGIVAIGFFMIGMPGDSAASIERTIEFARGLDIDFAKFTVFVPFPGTREYERLADGGGLPTGPDAWRRYSNYPSPTNPPVFCPDGLTSPDLVAFQKKAFFRFYARPLRMARQLTRIHTLRPSEVWAALGALMEGR